MPVSNVMDISGKKTDKGVSLPEFKLDFDDLQLFLPTLRKIAALSKLFKL